jgi:steroid delta-isomerase-like uncharacterized protein
MKRKLRSEFTLLTIVMSIAAPMWAADSCKNPGTPAENTALVKKFYAAFNTKNKVFLDTTLTSDWIDIPLAAGQKPGREGMKGIMDVYWASFPDLNVVNEDFVIQGNKVAVRSTVHATHKGDFATVKASGKPIAILAIDIHEICDGRIIKTWHAEDWLSGLFQIGGLPVAR